MNIKPCCCIDLKDSNKVGAMEHSKDKTAQT